MLLFMRFDMCALVPTWHSVGRQGFQGRGLYGLDCRAFLPVIPDNGSFCRARGKPEILPEMSAHHTEVFPAWTAKAVDLLESVWACMHLHTIYILQPFRECRSECILNCRRWNCRRWPGPTIQYDRFLQQDLVLQPVPGVPVRT